MKKWIIVALCIAVPLLYFSYRIWNAFKEKPTLQESTVSVIPGRYWLDNGQKNAYLEVGNCDPDNRTFELTLHSVDMDELKEYLIDSQYRPITEWDYKINEDGDQVPYTAQECEQINRESMERISKQADAFCSQAVHVYAYSEPTEIYAYADWYTEQFICENDCIGENGIIVFPKKLMFEDYIWILADIEEKTK